MFPLGFQAALNLGDTGFLGHANCSVEGEKKFKAQSLKFAHTSFFFKNVCFLAQAEYFYFFADFRLKLYKTQSNNQKEEMK